MQRCECAGACLLQALEAQLVHADPSLRPERRSSSSGGTASSRGSECCGWQARVCFAAAAITTTTTATATAAATATPATVATAARFGWVVADAVEPVVDLTQFTRSGQTPRRSGCGGDRERTSKTRGHTRHTARVGE
jgi:hypothetical protein